MKRRLVHSLVFLAGVLACAYVSVVLTWGMHHVHWWMIHQAPQRALWVLGGSVLMTVPGAIVAWLSIRYLMRRRKHVDPRRAFPVLPPR